MTRPRSSPGTGSWASIPLFAPGEDCSYNSHDGLRASARLYLPADRLGYEGPRPVIHYVHGGPQGRRGPTSPGSPCR